MKGLRLNILNIITLVFMLIMNTFAVVLPLNNISTADISARYDNLFVPAGITFAIWSVIFILLIAFVIKQFLQIKNKNEEMTLKVGYWFAISNLANGFWIIAWHNLQIVLSVVLMLVILISLIIIHLKLEIKYDKNVNIGTKFAVYLPISVYLGWISVATIANIAALAVYLNWLPSITIQTLLTISVIIIASALAYLAIIKNRDYGYSAVIIWALIGISINRLSNNPTNFPIVSITILCIIFITLNLIMDFVRKQKYLKDEV